MIYNIIESYWASHQPFFATARAMIAFLSDVPLAQHYQKVYLSWEHHRLPCSGYSVEISQQCLQETE